MIYTNMTKKALRIAFDAHKEQVDKTGLPYIFHPFHLAEQMRNEISVCAALLHDVVEDTSMTFEDLAAQGISNEVIDILRLLTHDDATPYMDYIHAIKDSDNKDAVAVKLADLRHNSDSSRLDEVDEQMITLFEKYQTAIKALEQVVEKVSLYYCTTPLGVLVKTYRGYSYTSDVRNEQKLKEEYLLCDSNYTLFDSDKRESKELFPEFKSLIPSLEPDETDEYERLRCPDSTCSSREALIKRAGICAGDSEWEKLVKLSKRPTFPSGLRAVYSEW